MTVLRLALAAALLALAAALPAFGSPSAAGPGRTITAIGQAVGFTSVDVDRNGKRTIGDYEIGQTLFVSPRSGKPLGRGTVICTMINNGGTDFQCQGQNRFAGGDIVHAGRFSVAAKTYRLAIVGGTGVYEGARGNVTGTWLDSKFLRQRVVFSLAS
jgi:hypothetical protein